MSCPHYVYCGEEGHHEVRCAKWDKVEAAKCIRYGHQEVNHPVSWVDCPVAELQKRILRSNTRYEED